MAGVVTLARALAEGGAVIWKPLDRPRLRVGRRWVEPLRQEVAEVRDVLGRAVAFRRQLAEWTAGSRRALPTFALPEAPEPHAGSCISCGAHLVDGWRCRPCIVAVYVALDTQPPVEEGAEGAAA